MTIFVRSRFRLVSRAIAVGLALIAAAMGVPASFAVEDDEERRASATNSIGMRFVWVPAGAVTIGSPEDEPARDDNESQREVRMSKGYFLGECEVTQQQFEAVMGRNPSAFSASGDRRAAVKGLATANLPVETVTWADAVEFCRRLSELADERRAGRTYRLPTEAEWEYACRAGERASWSFGGEVKLLPKYAWFGRQASDNRPHAVGTKLPNRWGIYDMHGNVWEWCGDVDMRDEHARFIRGGSWFSLPANTRSATRRDDPATVTDPDTGFRVVLEQSSPAKPSATPAIER